MNITDIRIRRTQKDSPIKAIISVTFDQALVIHDIKIIENGDGSPPFLAMPSKRLKNGEFRDVAHPIHKEAREALEEAVFEAYKDLISQDQEED